MSRTAWRALGIFAAVVLLGGAGIAVWLTVAVKQSQTNAIDASIAAPESVAPTTRPLGIEIALTPQDQAFVAGLKAQGLEANDATAGLSWADCRVTKATMQLGNPNSQQSVVIAYKGMLNQAVVFYKDPEQAKLLVDSTFPHLASLRIEGVQVAGRVLRIETSTGNVSAACPGCSVQSSRVHSRYQRRLSDTAIAGREVLLVRRLLRGNAECSRRTFAEQVPALAARHGRRTVVARRVLCAVALALDGRAGARLTRHLAVSVSRMTLLRQIRALPDPVRPTPRVLGVADRWHIWNNSSQQLSAVTYFPMLRRFSVT